MKRTHKILTAGLVIISVIQIWRVNHSYNMRNYQAEVYTYKAGSTVNLPNEMYYIDSADLTGYTMRVLSTRLMDTETFLKEYHSSFSELKKITQTDYSDYGMIYLVNAEFENTQWDRDDDRSVLLDNFLLVGSDYFLNPAMDSINLLSNFNPELGGASAFEIRSSRTFQVMIPYLINTKSADKMSKEYFLKSSPALLIAEYPKEIYLELPKSNND